MQKKASNISSNKTLQGSLCMGTNYFKPHLFVVFCLLGWASLPKQVATGQLSLGTQTRVSSTITRKLSEGSTFPRSMLPPRCKPHMMSGFDSFLLKKKNVLFIYLFIWLRWVLVAGSSLRRVGSFLWRTGSSLRRAGFSLVTEHGLQGTQAQ